MIRKALRRARTRYGIVVVAALFFIVGLLGAVGVTSAFYKIGFDTKTATFAGGYVAVPTTPTFTAVGYDGSISWTPGTVGVNVQQIFGADQGTTANCTSAVYSTTVTNTITSTASTYTDSNRATTPSNINGDYYCYEILEGYPTTTAPVWTATATTPVGQIGLALSPTGTNSIANHGTSGTIDKTDVVVLTFNQQTNYSTSSQTVLVCSFTSGVVLLGDTHSGGCSTASDTYSIAKLTLQSGTIGSADAWATSTAIASASSPWTITITLNASGSSHKSLITSQGSWKAVPSTSILSNATPDQATACTTAASTCTVTASGGF